LMNSITERSVQYEAHV